MCTQPVPFWNEMREKMHGQCRHCEECLGMRKRHWIGRLLAEEQSHPEVWFVTLTYGGGYDNPDAYWLSYVDVQNFCKLLRRYQYRFSYVAVGEHGGERDRAHWHLIIYWKGPPPKVEKMGVRFDWFFWKHGLSQCEYPRSKQGAAVYMMDYLEKDNLSNNLLKYSKVPPLGQTYLLEYARKHAREGLPLFPKGDRFTIPGNLAKNGDLFWYAVGRQTAVYTRMLDAWLLEWATVRPSQLLKHSPDTEEYLLDIVQDISETPLRVRSYLEDLYGEMNYAPERDFETITYHTPPNWPPHLQVEQKLFTSALIGLDQKGNEIWRVVVDETAAEHQNLCNRVLLALLNKCLKKPHVSLPQASLRQLRQNQSHLLTLTGQHKNAGGTPATHRGLQARLL